MNPLPVLAWLVSPLVLRQSIAQETNPLDLGDYAGWATPTNGYPRS